MAENVGAWIVEIQYADSLLSFVEDFFETTKGLYIPSEKILIFEDYIFYDDSIGEDTKILKKIEVSKNLVENAKRCLNLQKRVLERFQKILDREVISCEKKL